MADCFSEARIIFDNDHGAFHPGDVIVGAVFVQAAVDLVVDRVQDLTLGAEEPVEHAQQSVTVNKELTTSEHTAVKFEFTCTADCPPSLSGKHASVLYYVKASVAVTQPERRTTLAIVRGLTLVERVELTQSKQFLEKSTWRTSKRFGFCQCTGGTVSMKVDLERQSFLPGENVVIRGEVVNDSNKTLDTAEVMLEKLVRVKAKNEYNEARLVSEENATVRSDHLAMFIEPHKTVNISKNFGIPSVRPSSSAAIAFKDHEVTVEYRLVCVLKRNKYVQCSIEVPVLVGTVPHEQLHRPRLEGPPVLHAPPEPQRIIYHRDRTEKPLALPDSDQAQADNNKYSNVYPYFVQLSTCSKQSRRMLRVANALKAESRWENMRQMRAKAALASDPAPNLNENKGGET